ncbi:hypothetical protein [Sorangium sp. So ce385]|uniref:hypothetical protein n=1 Tax=Sorangium sp. So ce385 TaxID=3133308 RepID=UPI003F5B15BF
MRTPGSSASDEAEVQAVYAQIVCRELWDERSAGKGHEPGVVEAEAILRRYLEATEEGLGPLKDAGRRLLEEHLIDPAGNRKPLTEKAARLVLPAGDATEVLERLERAGVLRAEERQGNRLFELGHDWLAKKVFERRQAREEEQRLARERAKRRRLVAIAAALGVAAVVMVGVVIWALGQRDAAFKAESVARAAQQRRGRAGYAGTYGFVDGRRS